MTAKLVRLRLHAVGLDDASPFLDLGLLPGGERCEVANTPLTDLCQFDMLRMRR